jgi:hypothetical protein
MAYAVDTKVPVTQTQNEIKQLLSKHNADGFAMGESQKIGMVMFQMKNRQIKITLPLPVEGVTKDNKSKQLLNANKIKQLERSRWRALLLTIKAKLEAVEIGISTFEDEFLAHVILPDGATVGKFMQTQLEETYKTGKMPPLLGFGGKN